MKPLTLKTQSQTLDRTSSNRTDFDGNRLGPEVAQIIYDLARLRIIPQETLSAFFKRYEDRLKDAHTRERFCTLLVSAKLLTAYQMARILSNQINSLILGNYILIDRLSSGTVGVVFLAEHLHLRRKVALKILNWDPSMPQSVLERFYYESKVLNQIHHKNVAEINDAGIAAATDFPTGSAHYISLEYVDGADLENFVYAKNTPLDVKQMCDFMSQAAWGLQAIHEASILHRDLKPSNMLISSNLALKIVDFGIALDLKSKLNYAEELLGSIDFMSLEQSENPLKATPASDIYSLGVCCFWLLTGATPLPQSKSIPDSLKIIREGQFRKIKQYRTDVPAELEGGIMRMLERDPRRRINVARDAAMLLERFSGKALSSSPVILVEDHPQATEPKSAESREETVYQTLVSALEIKEQSGPQRSSRLVESLNEICRVLAKSDPWDKVLDQRMMQSLSWAVRLTDIAQLLLPEKYFSSRSLLTREENENVRNHPLIGSQFLEAAVRQSDPSPRMLKIIAQGVEAHHERVDGSGYPQALKGEQYPFHARIVAVIDAYENLRRSSRGKLGLSHDQAFRKILQGSGQEFDVRVVQAFQECASRIYSIYDNYPAPA
ncbi:protein kinase [Telmatocola sphagniphila]|uniref:Protein kinase n=1 Tax=Telmatocola sphagniphila TaxID=1123043 RepID=A0A8E6BAE6_9BACT|nr:protein kinase [Telmatocola sphagniphila]QVL34337.1 protein kinase [Telmatocola sphagniphila]